MLTVDEAFRKFKSRLELNDSEQKNASARQTEVREYLDTKFAIDRSFLTGSYARYTKTKPLKDIDIFFVLKESEQALPVQGAIRRDRRLLRCAGREIRRERRAQAEPLDQCRFRRGDRRRRQHRLPDRQRRCRPGLRARETTTRSPTTIPASGSRPTRKSMRSKATAAHQAYSNEWKGLVRMVKYWNNNPRHGEKPVKPSFLIEVMALQCLYGGWQGRFDYEIQGSSRRLADRIFDDWPDPAGLGPPISNGMDAGPQAARARPADGREPGRDYRHRPCSSGTQRRSLESLARAVRPEVSAFVTGDRKSR